jgi:hypothetical protein
MQRRRLPQQHPHQQVQLKKVRRGKSTRKRNNVMCTGNKNEREQSGTI